MAPSRVVEAALNLFFFTLLLVGVAQESPGMYPAHHCLFVFLGRSVPYARYNIESWKLSVFSSSFFRPN
jgi:hypothetical protein